MKKLYIHLLLLFFIGLLSNNVYAQIVNIPDAAFKTILLGNSSINTNSDGEIQTSEAATYTGAINVSSSSITSLTGIEAFTAITNLDCSNNSLTSLNVSANTNLTSLKCFSNQLTSLDVSTNTALTYLNCNINQLSSLDVSNKTALTFLGCGGNVLTNLNVSGNTALTSLQCSNNTLTNLDVSTNTALQILNCSINSLTDLDVSNNTALIDLDCSANSLTSLNIKNSNNLNLTGFNAIDNSSLTCIQVDDAAYMNLTWSAFKDSGANYEVVCVGFCNISIITSIEVNSNPVSNGELFLFKQDLANNRMDTISVITMSSSSYTFTGIDAGFYLVFFKPNAISNPNTPGYYNSSTPLWNNATLLEVACGITLTITINATSLATITGPGTISGKVEKGNGFGKVTLVGDPIPGVDISLEQNPGGNIIIQTQSDSNGDYSFSNIPLNDYRVRVSIPGTPHTAYYDVSLSASEAVKSNLIYVVDVDAIYPLSDNINLIAENNTTNSLKIIPNPFNSKAVIILSNEFKTKQTVQIIITDISSKTVANYKYANNEQIVIEKDNLQNGLYFVKISTNEKTLQQKIVIVD